MVYNNRSEQNKNNIQNKMIRNIISAQWYLVVMWSQNSKVLQLEFSKISRSHQR